MHAYVNGFIDKKMMKSNCDQGSLGGPIKR